MRMLSSVEYCVEDPDNWIFQQDNVTCHKSSMIMEWFDEEEVEIMEFPANSPDLNPIENLWWITKCKIYRKGPFNNTEEVWEQFETEWENIEPEICCKLIESMPKRIQAVIKSKGEPTKC